MAALITWVDCYLSHDLARSVSQRSGAAKLDYYLVQHVCIDPFGGVVNDDRVTFHINSTSLLQKIIVMFYKCQNSCMRDVHKY